MEGVIEGRKGEIDVKELRNIVRERLSNIQEKIEELETEKGALETIIKEFLDPCPGCNGYGEIAVSVDQDCTRFEVCEACKGTGNRKK